MSEWALKATKRVCSEVVGRNSLKTKDIERLVAIIVEESEAQGLLEAAKRAVEAMQSAWYELQPGTMQAGDQFIRQGDMRERMDALQLAIRAFEV